MPMSFGSPAVGLAYLFFICTVVVLVGALECEKSGYCSVGKVKPWSGDILSGANMRAALEARSYQKEIIIGHVTGGHMLQVSLSLYEELQSLGFGHFMFVTLRKEDCDVIMAALPHAGCCFDSTEHHPMGFQGLDRLWHSRSKFFMRASRLGYNVLSIDLDVLVLNDPYVHLKQPPFANISMFASMEWSPCGINAGFMYSQNTAPNGPVTWMFKEVVERPLRMLDDDLATVKNWSLWESHKFCQTFDQSFLDDCFHSTLRPSPVYRRMMSACGGKRFYDLPHVYRLNSLMDNRCETFKRTHSSGVDGSQLRGLPSRNTWTHGAMRVPNVTEAEWHRKFLNRTLLPEVRGNWSQALWDQLRDDCPACPPWRDEIINGTMAGADPSNELVEHFAFVPQWLASNFETSGRDGFWSRSPSSGERPLQVLGHVHGFVGALGPAAKYGMKMMYHPPANFSVLAAHHPKHMMYFNSQPVTRVLALDPTVDLSTVARSLSELHRVMGGLLQLSTLSGRTTAWPVLRCSAPWLLLSQQHMESEQKVSWLERHPMTPNKVPLYLSHGVVPHVDELLKPEYACFSASFMGEICAEGAQGLLPVEFRHWRDSRGAVPTVNNTVLVPGADLVGRLMAANASSIAVLSLEDAKAALQQVDNETIVYVGWAYLVDGFESEERFVERAKSCRGLYKAWLHGAQGGLLEFVQPGMPRVGLSADQRTLEWKR